MTSRRYSSPPVTALDVVLVVLGTLFFVVSALCIIGTVTLLLSWGGPSPGFPVGERFVGFAKGFGLAFFPIAGLVSFATGWWLAGAQLRRWIARRRQPDE